MIEGEKRRALSAAYRMLARRDHSVHEVKTSLEKKGFAGPDIEWVLQALGAKGLLNDQKFAHNYTQSLVRHKKAGPRYIKDALRKKGIGESASEEAVGNAYGNPEAERKMARQLAAKKGATLKPGLSPIQRKKRIFDYLSRRGFSYDAIMKALGGREEEE